MMHRLVQWARRSWRALFSSLAILISFSVPTFGATCPPPLSLGPNPSRLIVVVPATGQGPAEWQSFLTRLRKDPRSEKFDWLVFDHQVGFTSFGNARDVANELASCIDEKVKRTTYERITLIGHS